MNTALRELLGAFLFCALTAVGTGAAHPLDPLSADEIATAVAVLREAGDVDAATRFSLIGPRCYDVETSLAQIKAQSNAVPSCHE